MSKNDILVELDNVSIHYGHGASFFNKKKFTALDSIGFTINRGESIAIIGRNGAGKSTLLRLLGGVILPDEGCLINRAKTTTLLALSLGFDENLTGQRNAVMCSMLMGVSRKTAESGLDEIAEFADIGEFFNMPVKTYSSGMRSRLAFAIASTIESDLLLIDEVLAVGDADFREKSRKAMEKKILGGSTCVLVSHQMGDVRKLCSKVVWIEKGKVVMSGSTKDVLNEYEK